MASDHGTAFGNWTGTNPRFILGAGERGETSADGVLYSITGGTTPWALLDNFATEGDVYDVGAIIEFNGELFVGTARDSVGASVYNSTDGQTFTLENTFAIPQRSIQSAAVFGSHLYVGTSLEGFQTGSDTPEIHRRTTGGVWSLAEAFANTNDTVTALEVFSGFLYATIQNPSGGTPGEIWRSSDGTTWTQVHTFAGFRDDPTDMKVFDGALYVCIYEEEIGGNRRVEVYRSTNGTTWNLDTTLIPTSDGFKSTRMASTATNLFVGTGRDNAGVTFPSKSRVYQRDTSGTWVLSLNLNDDFPAESHENIDAMGVNSENGRIYCTGTAADSELGIFVCPTSDAP